MISNSQRIFCATDFSERAQRAVAVAAQLASRQQGTLLLAHVVENSGPKALAAGRARTEAEVKRLAQAGTKAEAVVLQSAWPARVLLSAIEAKKPGLVVLSAAVKTSFDRWAFGSVSEQVAQSSSAPTLVVRDAAGFKDWDWSGRRLKVLVALDLYTTSDAVLRWVKELRQAGPCDFIHAYANERPPEGKTTERDTIPTQPENPPTVQERLERDMRKKVRDVLGDDEAEVIVRPVWGEPEGWLVELAIERKVDLVVVGTHRRRGLSRLFHGSVSRELLRMAGTNVACVPVTAEFRGRDAHIREFRRVLVATDFSELGNAAIPYACGMCAIGGLVRIIHVASPARQWSDKERAAQARELKRQLKELVPDEFGARGQPPEVEVLVARDAGEEICREADRFGADAICVASHGLGGSRAVFGSTTKTLLKLARRPVLIVRRPEE